jgi:hypothetical protein
MAIVLVLGLLATAALAEDMAAGPMHPMMPLARPWLALLTGTQSVPAVDSAAIGHASFALTADGLGLTFTIGVEGLVDGTAAHIHCGMPNQNGPVVANLFTGTLPTGYQDNMWPVNQYYGELAMGTITAKDLVGPLAGKSINCLLAMIHGNCAYVNVHTKAHPDGEIRGQLH